MEMIMHNVCTVKHGKMRIIIINYNDKSGKIKYSLLSVFFKSRSKVTGSNTRSLLVAWSVLQPSSDGHSCVIVAITRLEVNRRFHWFSKSLDLEKKGNIQMQLNAKLSLIQLDYIK